MDRTGPAWRDQGAWYQWEDVETIPGMGGGGIKENGCGAWIQVWYIWNIIRTFVNATMYPHLAQ
jgi:hypothetical protein